MSDLEQRIIEILEKKPRQKATEIALQLQIDKKLVNSALYGQLKGKVTQDNTYRWSLIKVNRIEPRQESYKPLNTPLAILCRYYLDCLSYDDLGGVREFASSKYGAPNYVELNSLPMADPNKVGPFESEPAKDLLRRIQRDRNRQTVFLGYPVRLTKIRSRKGWEGFMVEPLFLYSFHDALSKHGVPSLTDDLPQINFRALRSLTNSGDTNAIEEATQLAEELGLGDTLDNQPDIDELFSRLRDIRPEWDWKEVVDPINLSNGVPLSDLDEQGIYNRAILVAAERSPYTRGLESELGALQTVEEGTYRETSIGAWLQKQTIESPPADQKPLLEILPLNSEQRQAVRQSLSNPLTVITGPPGTGKSQVVTSILVNATWQGKTVLFASKNNKAVDVVETRVNALGPRPSLLRLGANEYQTKLAEYLVSLLGSATNVSDREQYSEYETIHSSLTQKASDLDTELQQLISLRNEVDHLEQQVETLRENVGNQTFQSLKTANCEELIRTIQHVLLAIRKVDRSAQPFIVRILWPLYRGCRFAHLWEVTNTFREIATLIGLPLPSETNIEAPSQTWIQYAVKLEQRAAQISATRLYFQKLQALTKARSIEDVSKQQKLITEKLIKNSEALWQAWLRLQPSRLTQEERKRLGDYSSILQLIAAANTTNQQIGKGVFRRYYQLFPQIISILPCWAITSLSARGRVPFVPSFFDLLVIDEASQCDIASALPLLYRARRVVVIGDPKQLRHISTMSKPQDQQLLSKHSLLDNFTGWAYSTRSLFDLASSLCKSEDIIFLRDHHRSHADIIEFSNAEFYKNDLRVATNYDGLRRPYKDGPAVRWINIHGRTVRPGSGGAVNEIEAESVVQEIKRLINQGYQGSIGVVSPFRAQANRIRDLVYADNALSAHIGAHEFLADVVHKFQGDERDVIIFSPVVSADTSDGALWFLRNTPNLFNVAITRARSALIIVGDKAFASNSQVEYLAKFAGYVDDINNRTIQPNDTARADRSRTYPSVSNPEQVSDWEKLFYKALYKAGIKAMPQYVVEKYILDFAIQSGQRYLDVEIDGEHYHRNWNGDLCRRDQIRNHRLMELGWDVIRFWVYQVRDDLDHCVTRVQQWLAVSQDVN